MKAMKTVGIDSHMIAKAQIRILLYKGVFVSHSASLEDKQRIKLKVLMYPGFNVHFMLFP